MLTIFIPSYNRAEKLDRALNSIFAALCKSQNAALVEVLVVDDHSSEDIGQVVAKHQRAGHELQFFMHRERCGVAEIAMLRSLEYVRTRFAWCLGNDDTVLPNTIDRLLTRLQSSKSEFFLLNFLGREAGGEFYEYLVSAEEEIAFASGREFFSQFGFVTATTTFPCLCFAVEPVRSVDLESLIAISPIYSHTSAFYLAFFNRPCSFLPQPAVLFNHNEGVEEQQKLEARNLHFQRPAYFHASAGLARHLMNLAKLTTVPLAELAEAHEDEIDKQSKLVKKTLTGHFVAHFSMLQFQHEIEMTFTGPLHDDFRFFTRSEVEDIQRFLRTSGLEKLSRRFLTARDAYCSQQTRTKKIKWLKKLMQRTFADESARIAAYESAATSFLSYGQKSGRKGIRSAPLSCENAEISSFT